MIFYPGTSKDFSVTITLDGSAPDITNDTVTLRLKENKNDSDSDSKLEKEADVESQWADGKALFELEPADTDIATGMYWYDIEWIKSGADEYILDQDTVNVKERVSDS